MKKIFVLFCLAVGVLFAGGPILRINNQAIGFDPSQVLFFHLDAGDLNPATDGATVRQWAAEEFAEWDAVPGSRLRIQRGPDQTTNITSIAELNAATNAGLNSIVWDESGQVFQDLGFGGNTLAFAGPVSITGDGRFLAQFRAIFGGTPLLGANENLIRGTLLHEFGHGLGLAHSAVNGDVRNGNFQGLGSPPASSVEIMYWQAVGGMVPNLKTDDVSGYLALYGDSAQGTGGLGAISGRVLLPNGVTPADGINVIVRDPSGGRDTIFTKAASVITCCADTASYFIPGLPPGSYSVEISDIGLTGAQAGYSDPIRTNQSDTSSTRIGPFPGEEEFFNGISESSNPEVDDPTAIVTVNVTANATVENIDIVFNREEGIQGSTLPNIYVVPEVQVTEDKNTFIGLVNPDGDDAVAVEIFGFSEAGNVISPTNPILNMAPLSKVWLSVAEAFGDDAVNVGWIQVGSVSPIYVFAELQSPDTRSAYWSSNGLTANAVMPHIAKNTVVFKTLISSVNGKMDAANTQLVEEPGKAQGLLTEHLTGYSKSGKDVRAIFGDDLSAIDWVRLESDQTATASMEYFVTPVENETKMASLGLNNQRGKTLRFLHIATNTALFWTGLVYINVGDVNVTASETYYNDAGEVIKTFDRALGPGQKVTLLFDAQNQVEVPPGSAWMKVRVPEDSGTDLVGYELFGSSDPAVQDVFTGLQGTYTSGIALDYPHFQFGANDFTAIVATNVGNESADFSVSAIGADGTILETTTLTDIAPNTKVVRLVGTGGAALFTNPNTLANAAWVRATPSGSTWSGFMLWGDGAVVRQFLSGIGAASRGESGGSGNSADILQETTEPHDSYETAMPLSARADGSWNVNVVAQISDGGGATPVVNTCCGDGIEDIYTFTLTEPTSLAIAVASSPLSADLDLYVFNDALPSQNFFNATPPTDPNIDYSGNPSGVETIAREFQPGTYYILVSHFVGDVFPDADYGLLLTSTGLVLNTFNDADSLANWTQVPGNNDSDAQSDWDHDSNFTESKYGNALVQGRPAVGQTEDSLVISPSFEVPNRGVTIFDFDLTAVTTGPVASGNSLGVFLVDGNLDTTQAANLMLTWNQGSQGNFPVTFDGAAANVYGFTSWTGVVAAVNNSNFVPGDFTIAESRAGENLSFGFLGTSFDVNWVIDNFRLVNILTTLNKRKAPEPGQILIPHKGLKPGFGTANPAFGRKLPLPTVKPTQN